jgi:hypothetical protein
MFSLNTPPSFAAPGFVATKSCISLSDRSYSVLCEPKTHHHYVNEVSSSTSLARISLDSLITGFMYVCCCNLFLHSLPSERAIEFWADRHPPRYHAPFIPNPGTEGPPYLKSESCDIRSTLRSADRQRKSKSGSISGNFYLVKTGVVHASSAAAVTLMFQSVFRFASDLRWP